MEETKQRGYELSYDNSSTITTIGSSTTEVETIKVGGRRNTVNWSEVRKLYVLGKRKQLTDGSWVSEDYTQKELAEMYNISLARVKQKSASEGWSKYRQAYLTRVNELSIGQELGLYTSDNYESEVAAIQACNKLGTVLQNYIEYKFRDILDASEDINKDGSEEISEELKAKLEAVNRNTGIPIYINEIKEAIKVANDIYTLQRKVYDNSPKADSELISNLSHVNEPKPKFKSEKKDNKKIKQLEAKLGRKLSEYEQTQNVEATPVAV